MVYKEYCRGNVGLTFAIAEDAPIGVILATYSGKLSRTFAWDTRKDTITPGQFLKGRVNLTAISPDGKYYAYRAESLQKIRQAYTAIAKPLFFTALAFFPHSPNTSVVVEFLDNGDIEVLSERDDLFYVDNYILIQERIAPGFPHTIHRTGTWSYGQAQDCLDPHNPRRIYAEGFSLFAETLESGEIKHIGDFPRERFEPIEPPEWAKVW